MNVVMRLTGDSELLPDRTELRAATRRVRQHLLYVCAATLLVLTGLTVSAAAFASELESDTHWVGTWSASAQSADLFFVPTPGQFDLNSIESRNLAGAHIL